MSCEKIFVHILTYNSSKYIASCINSTINQSDFIINENLKLVVTDNNSSDGTLQILKELEGKNHISYLNILPANIGFAGGHNLGTAQFLNSDCSLLLIINPDLALAKDALKFFSDTDKYDESLNIGCISGKILRADEKLTPLTPPVIDSTGIVFTNSFRHLDRGAGEIDNSEYDKDEIVSGLTGACMFMNRSFVQKVSFRSKFDSDVLRVYPHLLQGIENRVQLFDEAFFAYREDADLALRARNLGVKFKYYSRIVGYHVRTVTPERREILDAEINSMSVRNRFLLQINNFDFKTDWMKIVPGLFFRNLIVILAVVIKERSSRKALREVFLLLRRALYRNKFVN